ncbi:hypothetical protein FXO38_33030 [Capsicum annuum]|nr:hypothetical protein FXO38_33030 [Capsicum annuum]
MDHNESNNQLRAILHDVFGLEDSDSLHGNEDSYGGYADGPYRYLDNDDEDLQNLADEEMNRSHQSVQDEDLSVFDDKEDYYREERKAQYMMIATSKRNIRQALLKSILLGYALLTSEDIETYAFVTTMGKISPTAILIDQCESIKAIIREVLPNTVHRFKYEKELESQASERKQIVLPAIAFNWDMQISDHYTRAIYDFFRVHVVRLPYCENKMHIDFDAVEGVEEATCNAPKPGPGTSHDAQDYEYP